MLSYVWWLKRHLVKQSGDNRQSGIMWYINLVSLHFSCSNNSHGTTLYFDFIKKKSFLLFGWKIIFESRTGNGNRQVWYRSCRYLLIKIDKLGRFITAFKILFKKETQQLSKLVPTFFCTIDIWSGPNIIKLFTAVILNVWNKLERLSMMSISSLV